MLRYPAIFLVGVFFTFGPAPFERLHLAEVNSAWNRIEQLMNGGSRSPLKRLPVPRPFHDPSTCVICATLHAPVTIQYMPPIMLMPTARLGSLPVELPNEFQFVYVAAEHCRGPPAA